MSNETADARTRRVLQEHHLPLGLLPPGITSADISPSGSFVVQYSFTIERRHGGHRVRFGTRISGQLGKGAVLSLKGVDVKQMMWFPVGQIRAVEGALEFHVGPVKERLSLSEFPYP